MSALFAETDRSAWICKHNLLVKVVIITVLGIFSSAIKADIGHPVLKESTLSAQMDHSDVTKVLRDRRGSLWIGSQEGLYRFDGNLFKKFGSGEIGENYITESHVTDIAEGRGGEIFVATYTGHILSWSPANQTFEKLDVPDISEEAVLGKIIASSSGALWIAARDRLVYFDPKLLSNGRWLEENSYVDLLGRPNVIVEGPSGTIWVGSSNGLFKISSSEKTVQSVDIRGVQFSKIAEITALLFSSDGSLYIGTDTGELAQVELLPTGQTNLLAKLNRTLGHISELVHFKEHILAGSDTGLFWTSPDLSNSTNIIDTPTKFPSSVIDDLHVDGNHIWVGTLGGLGILSLSSFETIQEFGKGSSTLVYAFNEFHDGSLWVGTYDGLYTYSRELTSAGHITKFEQQLTEVQRGVSSIEIMENDIWIGLFRGGALLLNREGQIRKKFPLSSSEQTKVTRILADKNHRDVWIATYGNGLYKLTDERKVSLYEEGILPENAVHLIEYTDDGTLFVGALNRMYRYIEQDGSFEKIEFDYGANVQKPIIYSLRSNSTGDIWIGTKGHGLFKWLVDDQKNQSFQLQKPNLDSLNSGSTIYGIKIDSTGNLWCSTENGIIRLNDDGMVTGKFTTSDGLQGDDFNLGAAFVDSSGEIYFGGTNGFNIFDPNKQLESRAPADLVFTAVAFANRMPIRNFTKSLTLITVPFEERYITFNFATLDFIDPTKNQYRYKLENFDSEWVDSGTENSATYTNLPSGNYTFRVQGSNSSGIWNREGVSLDIKVLPPPWLTWWAYTLYCFAACLVLWGLHRIYYSYVIDRKATELALEMHLAEERADDEMQEQVELQEDLVQSAYEHNIATLSLVDDFLDNRLADGEKLKGSPEDLANRKRLQVLSYLEECLYFQPGGPTADLHKFSDMAISHLLAHSPVDPNTIVSVNDVTKQLIPTSVASPMSVVIYELLENVINHAFEPGSPANYLEVSLQRARDEGATEEHYLIKVGDSGIGVPQEFAEATNGSTGLGLVRVLLAKLNGSINIKVNEGTTVLVSIPAPRGI